MFWRMLQQMIIKVPSSSAIYNSFSTLIIFQGLSSSKILSILEPIFLSLNPSNELSEPYNLTNNYITCVISRANNCFMSFCFSNQKFLEMQGHTEITKPHLYSTLQFTSVLSMIILYNSYSSNIVRQAGQALLFQFQK